MVFISEDSLLTITVFHLLKQIPHKSGHVSPLSCCSSSCYCGISLFCSTFLHVALLLHLLFLEFQSWRVLIPCRNPANSIPAGWRCSLYLHSSPVRNSLHQVDFLIWTQLCSIDPLLMAQPSEVPEQSVYFSFLDILQMCAQGSLVFLALHPHLLLRGKFHEFSQFIPNIIADLSENQIHSLLCTYQCGRWKCWSLSPVQFFVTLCSVAHQVPLSVEFSKQEYWNG